MSAPKTLALLCLSLTISEAAAQDLVITNARIIAGTGTVIEDGSVIVRGGRIESLAFGASEPRGSPHIDAGGMTVMPGMIDTHTHSHTDTVNVDMNRYLEMGFTTVLTQPVIGRITVGPSETPMPRVLVTAPAAYAGLAAMTPVMCSFDPVACEGVALIDSPALADETVRGYVEAGADALKAAFDPTNPLFTAEQKMPEEIFAAYAEAADAHGIPLLVHAMRLPDAIRAMELGADRLMHAPLVFSPGYNVETAARRLAEAGIPISTTAHGFSPVVDEDGVLRVHDGREYSQEDTHLSAAGMARLRMLWDAGAILAFGTDSVFDTLPRPESSALEGSRSEFVIHEIETLRRAFSPPEIITMLTRNAAVFLALDDEIGTLEPGKLADLVIVDGNPLEDVSALVDVAIVIQRGEVVVDHRE